MKKLIFFISSSLIGTTMGVGLYLVANLIAEKYDTSSFEAILYHLHNRIDGTDSEVVWQFASCFVMPFCAVLLAGALILFVKKLNKFAMPLFVLGMLAFFVGSWLGLKKMGLVDYLVNKTEKSNLIENNYVPYDNALLIRPAHKKNLIVLYVESMEATYMSVAEGGAFEVNMIPNLTRIARENISFSSTDKLGGTTWIEGTGWTSAGVVSTTAGIPVFSPFISDQDNKECGSFSGVVTLADILHVDGYYERFLMGSDMNFGGLAGYETTHGQVDVVDSEWIKRNYKLNYYDFTGWGVSDKVVFDVAKNDLDSISKNSSRPFFYSIMTIDTHSPNGHVSNDCDCHFNSSYANAISCSDQHIGDFYDWLKQQPFFENTVVIIMGDHLTMNNGFYEGKNVYDRFIYNAFINSAVAPINKYNRSFTQLDIYPSILAAMGYKINGDRLALGANLFSNEPSLYEKYGLKYVLGEFRKFSPFYYESILKE